MDYKKLNTNYKFKFADGEEVNLTLAFYALMLLRGKNKSLYERYNKAMLDLSKEKYDELEVLVILYVAYMCALDEGVTPLTETEFIIKCGSDRQAVMTAVKTLTQPKKK